MLFRDRPRQDPSDANMELCTLLKSLCCALGPSAVLYIIRSQMLTMNEDDCATVAPGTQLDEDLNQELDRLYDDLGLNPSGEGMNPFFQPSESWTGPMQGCFFGTGARGLGYYQLQPSVAEIQLEARSGQPPLDVPNPAKISPAVTVRAERTWPRAPNVANVTPEYPTQQDQKVLQTWWSKYRTNRADDPLNI